MLLVRDYNMHVRLGGRIEETVTLWGLYLILETKYIQEIKLLFPAQQCFLIVP